LKHMHKPAATRKAKRKKNRPAERTEHEVNLDRARGGDARSPCNSLPRMRRQRPSQRHLMANEQSHLEIECKWNAPIFRVRVGTDSELMPGTRQLSH
jgi:hypothetical protein